MTIVVDEVCDERGHDHRNLIGCSPAFQEAVELIRHIAETDAPVLIEGETGTGKEVAARAIHYSGSRQDRAFVAVNCGALPEQLIENELFGHARGAYTDARAPQTGLVALADGGTLFLDEVESLCARGQVALLRFLQDLRYRPLGGQREEHANVRIIAATNVNLWQMVLAKQFRSDLYYRLQILFLRLPPLRERTGDPGRARQPLRQRVQRPLRLAAPTPRRGTASRARSLRLAGQRARAGESGAPGPAAHVGSGRRRCRSSGSRAIRGLPNRRQLAGDCFDLA